MIENVKDQELVLHCEAMLSSCHKLRDGGERILTIRVSEDDSAVLDMMMDRNNGMTAHTHIALAEVCPSSGEFVNQLLINQKELHANANPKTVRESKSGSKGPYGQEAKLLKQSGFFRRKDVWIQIAPDATYLKWLRRQPCAYTKQEGNKSNPIVPAHVRRVGYGAGTSIKPEYSAIPLLKTVHDKQHNHGESSIEDQEKWEKARIQYVEKWAWLTLRAALGYDSWALIPPHELLEWAKRKNIDKFLPAIYRQSEAKKEI